MNKREYNVLKNFMRSREGDISALSNRFLAMDIAQPAIGYQALAHSMGVPAQRIDYAKDIALAIKAGLAPGQARPGRILISA